MGWAHEHVRVVHDVETGLRAVIAVHSTALGPALGGLRMRPYPDTEAAVADARRLSAAMTFKAAAAGLDLGGGKAVILDDGNETARAERLRRFGQEVHDLGGRYITAEDVGTRTDDMDLLAEATPWVVGRSTARGGGGDPSPSTARTVLGAIQQACRVNLGRNDLGGTTVGVLGLGKVGWDLAQRLVGAGARVTVADVDPAVVERARDELGADILAPDEYLHGDFEVMAPCAVGGLVTPEAAEQLNARVVAGAANNVLSSDEAGHVLARRGIAYVPDYLANCGGLIHCSDELDGFDMARVEQRLDAAVSRIGDVLEEAAERGESALAVAAARVARRLGDAAVSAA